MSNIRRVGFVFALLTLVVGVGCHHTERIDLTNEYIDVVMAGISKRVVGAKRMRFGPMQATRLKANGTVRVCGTVTGLDMSGQSEWVRFVADLYDDGGDAVPVYESGFVGSTLEGSEGIDMMCAQADL